MRIFGKDEKIRKSMAVCHVKNHELVWQFQIYANQKVSGFSA